MYFEVIPTEVFRENGGALTYQSDQKLLPGQIVLVPLGKRTVTGIVTRKIAKVNFPTKPITRLLHPYPLPHHLLQSITWLAKYYLSTLPATASMMIPAGIAARGALKGSLGDDTSVIDKNNVRKPEPPSTTNEGTNTTNQAKIPLIELNIAQKTALKALQEASGTTRLLRGVTGSGKTNIYLKMAAECLKGQKSVILLVPEIALTSQLVRIFEQTFGNLVTVIHSNQTLSERRKTWLNLLEATCGEVILGTSQELSRDQRGALLECSLARNDGPRQTCSEKCQVSPTPQIVIGPRSALLSPLGNLGLIIIDEAHESAYYQENNPRYSALRLASFIARQLKIPCIAGTATPNIVDYHLAKTHHSLVELSQKAKTSAIDPEVTIVDLKDRLNFPKNRYFSQQLLEKITQNLHNHQQTLIFHNRRGSSPLTICEQCGWQALCPECYLPMTLHADGYLLTCHICGHEEKVPSSCPNCHHPDIIHKGFGTKLLETELKHLFPSAKITRFDGDNKKDHDLASLYHSVKSGEIDILIGTQTLARGLDLPHLATVGIVQADSGLALPDFAAEERSFELLTQVIGRVGRGHIDTANVIVQTYQPNHPVIQTAIKADYPTFASYLLQKRHAQQLPPFTYLARLAITYKTEKTTLAKIRHAHEVLSRTPNIQISPPMPAFHERTNRGYTWQLILKSPSRTALQKALLPFQKFRIELDPPSIL